MVLQAQRPDETDSRRPPGPTVLAWLIGGLLAVAVLWMLRAASSVFLPLAVAFFLAVAVLPVKRAVARRVPAALSWLGYVAAAGLVIGFLVLFVGALGIAARQIAVNAGSILPQLQQRLAGTPLADFVGDGPPQLLAQARSYAMTLIAGSGTLLGTLVVIFFLMLLMLLEAGDWRRKMISLNPADRGHGWRDVSRSVGEKFRKYFVTRLILGTITGALYAGWLALFGVPLLLVWAILALLLNFIPTIGSLIAGALPVVFVFAQQDVTTAVIVGAGILAIEQIMGNYIDPKVTGSQLALSPLVVLVSLLLWTWLWGIPGALLATPMTMLIAITLASIPSLRPVALLLSDVTDLPALEQAMSPGGLDAGQGGSSPGSGTR